jgi:hypothetical protein
MSQISYRANLASKSFPLISKFQGHTIIVDGNDQVYTRYGSPSERMRDVNTPQVYYMHNVLPTVEGYQAQTFFRESNLNYLGQTLDTLPYGSAGVIGNFGELFPFMNGNGGNNQIIHLMPGTQSDTNLYVKGISGAAYDLVTGTASTRIGQVSVCTVNGRSFIFTAGSPGALGEWNGSTNQSNTATAAGLNLTTTKGILSSFGYLIAFSSNSVAWSSVTDPLDFVPSTITGAGGGSIQELKGTINFATATAFGFILYTNANCVSATYTGNSRFPWKFKEIEGAAGVLNAALVSKDISLSGQYVYTVTGGIQFLTASKAINLFPEISDITNNFNEYFDTTTNQIVSSTTIAGAINFLLLAFINNRYLILSYVDVDQKFNPYGIGDSAGYALVYDTLLERWGKFRHEHRLVYQGPNSFNDIRFLSRSGVTWYAIFENSSITDPALFRELDVVLIFGKYQYVRGRRLVLDKIWADGVDQDFGNMQIYAYPSFDGTKKEPPQLGYLYSQVGNQVIYNFNLESLNHSILIKGWFNLTNLRLDFHLGART